MNHFDYSVLEALSELLFQISRNRLINIMKPVIQMYSSKRHISVSFDQDHLYNGYGYYWLELAITNGCTMADHYPASYRSMVSQKLK